MKNTQIGLCKEFPYEIRDGAVYCSTLCKNGEWKRSAPDECVKAFKNKESAQKYADKKGFGFGINIIIPYREWEQEE